MVAPPGEPTKVAKKKPLKASEASSIAVPSPESLAIYIVVLIKRPPGKTKSEVFLLGARDFLKSMGSVLRLSKKSDREQFFLYLKLVILGVGVVGTVGFLIKLLSTALPTIFG